MLDPISKNTLTNDKIIDSFIEEYNKYIPKEYDIVLTELLNNIIGYLKNSNDTIKEIKEELSFIKDIEFLNIELDREYINFNGEIEVNFRLSKLFPKIVKLRQTAYKIAYIISQELILGNEIPINIQNNILLLNLTLNDLILENFYYDLVIQNTDNSIERFYSKCDLIDLVIETINGSDITKEKIDKIKKELHGQCSIIFDCLNNLFVKNNQELIKK